MVIENPLLCVALLVHGQNAVEFHLACYSRSMEAHLQRALVHIPRSDESRRGTPDCNYLIVSSSINYYTYPRESQTKGEKDRNK